MNYSEQEMEALYDFLEWLHNYSKRPTVTLKEARIFQVELGGRLDEFWRKVFETRE